MIVLPRILRPEAELTSIIWMRIISSVSLIALALSPFLIFASVFYVLRQGMQMGAVPVRQSFAMGIVDESERATTSGATSMARSGFSAASPPAAGSLLPFVIYSYQRCNYSNIYFFDVKFFLKR